MLPIRELPQHLPPPPRPPAGFPISEKIDREAPAEVWAAVLPLLNGVVLPAFGPDPIPVTQAMVGTVLGVSHTTVGRQLNKPHAHNSAHEPNYVQAEDAPPIPAPVAAPAPVKATPGPKPVTKQVKLWNSAHEPGSITAEDAPPIPASVAAPAPVKATPGACGQRWRHRYPTAGSPRAKPSLRLSG